MDVNFILNSMLKLHVFKVNLLTYFSTYFKAQIRCCKNIFDIEKNEQCNVKRKFSGN